jgi:polyribonucleotide nucleotidyltransferase
MGKVIERPREEMSEFAPRIHTMRIDPEKIRDVIGKGGVTIRALTEETGTTIDIDDDGTIRIAATDKAAAEDARKRIERITADVEVGTVYDGKVVRITDFGAFVNILPGRDGMVHISQLAPQRVQQVSDIVSVGDTVRVKVLEIDRQGRVRLTMREVS